MMIAALTAAVMAATPSAPLTPTLDAPPAPPLRHIHREPPRDEIYHDSVLYQYGFENGWSSWTHQALNDAPRYWHLSDDHAWQGGQSWWCADENLGGYDNHWLQFLETPTLDLSDRRNLYLYFLLYYACEDPTNDPPANSGFEEYDAWDGCNVWISTDDGLTWEVLRGGRPEYDYESLFSFGYEWGMGPDVPGWAAYADDWTWVTFPLDDYASPTVRIRWAFCSDPAWATAQDRNAYGMLIDNIRVTDGDEDLFTNDASEVGEMRTSTGQAELWSLSRADAYEGRFSAWCRIMVNADNVLMTPWLQIPEAPWDRCRFDFRVRVDAPRWDSNNDQQPDDYFLLEVGTADGRWQLIAQDYCRDDDWRNQWQHYRPGVVRGDNIPDWRRNLDLTDFAGDSVRLRWRFRSDANMDDPAGTGLWLDDFKLRGLKRQRRLVVPEDVASLQEAIDQTLNGDTIIVLPGIYRENPVLSGKNLTIASLFWSTRLAAYVDSTVIDGAGAGAAFSFLAGVDSTTLLTGFRLTGGRSDFGGGIHCNAASPRIEYCLIDGNLSDSEGGGAYLRSSSRPVFLRCRFFDNQSASDGGALAARSSQPRLVNCTFYGNQAGQGREGGAVFCRLASVQMLNCLLWGDQPQEAAFYPRNDPNRLELRYCDVQGGPDAVATHNNGVVVWGEGCFDRDPRLSDPDASDLTLQPNSPCIDAGDPASPPDPDTSRADLGALPFHAGPRRLAYSPEALRFLEVLPGDSAHATLTVRNLGGGFLRLNHAELTDSAEPFRLEPPELPAVLREGEETTARVWFHPPAPGDWNTLLRLFTNDVTYDTLVIPVSGQSTGVPGKDTPPARLDLEAVRPNPFNRTALITFTLPRPAAVDLTLTDLNGRTVRSYGTSTLPAGRHQLTIDGTGLAAGLYLVQMRAEGRRMVGRALFIP